MQDGEIYCENIIRFCLHVFKFRLAMPAVGLQISVIRLIMNQKKFILTGFVGMTVICMAVRQFSSVSVVLTVI